MSATSKAIHFAILAGVCAATAMLPQSASAQPAVAFEGKQVQVESRLPDMGKIDTRVCKIVTQPSKS